MSHHQHDPPGGSEETTAAERDETNNMVGAVDMEIAVGRLDRDGWVGAQWWVSPEGDKLGLEITGPFTTRPAALRELGRIVEQARVRAQQWEASVGKPRIAIVPVFAPEPQEEKSQ